MINKKKVQVMTNLARSEKNMGKKKLTLSQYRKRDYVGRALIGNFFLVAIAYVFILVLWAGAHITYLLDNINRMNLFWLGTMILSGFLFLLVVYSIIAYVVYVIRYKTIQSQIREYDMQLKRLAKIYKIEEEKMSGRQDTDEEDW